MLLQPWDSAILQFPRARQITRALCLIELKARGIERFLDLGLAVNFLFLRLPAGCEARRLLFKIGQISPEGGQPVLRCGIAFLFERQGFNLHLDDLAIKRFNLFGLRFHLHPDAACGFVHQVNRFVRQEAVRDIAVRKRRSGDQGPVGNPHTVVQFIFLFQTAQDGD